MNDNELLLMLLQTIRVNGNTMFLLEHGYTLSTLNRDIDMLKKEGYVKSVKNGLSLTEKGEELFYFKNKELGRKGLYKYISCMLSLKDEPMPLDAVYVPIKRGKGRRNNNFS